MSRQVVRFDQFEVDLRSHELRKGGVRVRLQDQPFQILTMLLDRAGDVVTREEIRDRLWPDGTFVDFEHSMNAAIKRLRAALGDTAESPRFVETMHRRGYRFIATVEQPGGPVGTVDVSSTLSRPRLVVLPFANLGTDTLTAFIDTNGNGVRDADEPTQTANVAWTPLTAIQLAADSQWRNAIVAGAIRSTVRRSRLETRRCAFGAGARCGRLNHPAGWRGHTGADQLRFAHGRCY